MLNWRDWKSGYGSELPEKALTDELEMKLWERKQQYEARQLDFEVRLLNKNKAEWLFDRLRENPTMLGEDMRALAERYDEVLRLTHIDLPPGCGKPLPA